MSKGGVKEYRPLARLGQFGVVVPRADGLDGRLDDRGGGQRALLEKVADEFGCPERDERC